MLPGIHHRLPAAIMHPQILPHLHQYQLLAARRALAHRCRRPLLHQGKLLFARWSCCFFFLFFTARLVSLSFSLAPEWRRFIIFITVGGWTLRVQTWAIWSVCTRITATEVVVTALWMWWYAYRRLNFCFICIACSLNRLFCFFARIFVFLNGFYITSI